MRRIDGSQGDTKSPGELFMKHGTEMRTVMVVDDDPATVLALAHHVQHEGFTAVKAGSDAEPPHSA
jgi:hypothetical protein